MVFPKSRISRMTDPAKLAKLARGDNLMAARAAMDRLSQLVGSGSLPLAALGHDDLMWLRYAAPLQLRDAANWYDCLHALRTVDAFHGLSRWYPLLTQLMDGLATAPCPTCGRNLTLRRRGNELVAMVVNGIAEEIPFTEAGPLDPTERILYEAAAEHRPALVPMLLQLFSDLTCPSCGSAHRMGEARA